MSEQQQLQFSAWRSDGKYGQVLNLDGIHASVHYGKEKVGRAYQDIVCAQIWGMDTPRFEKRGFDSFHDAQLWCEKWYLYCSENIRLKKEVEHYRTCLRQESKALSELRALKKEEEWDEMRKKYGWTGEQKQ